MSSKLRQPSMKCIRYSKYVPDPAGEMSMEDLLSALSDYLLQSGFQSVHVSTICPKASRRWTTCAGHRAGADGQRPCSTRRCASSLQQMAMDGKLDELIEQLIERMQQEDYITIDQPHDPSRQSSVGGQVGENAAAGEIRNHRQEPRLPRLQIPARPAGLAGQIQLWTPRHARPGHRHRSQRRVARPTSSATR